MSQHGSYGVEDTYRGVISDVILQVREAFLDEGVDIDVLQQLKKTWEAKLGGSGAMALDGHNSSSTGARSGAAHQQQLQAVQQQQVPPPALRQPPPSTTPRQQLQHQQHPLPRQQPATATAHVSAMGAGGAAAHLSAVNAQSLLLSGAAAARSVAATNAAQQHQQQQNAVSAAVANSRQQQQQLGNTMAAELSSILQQQQQQQQQFQNAAGVPLLGLPAQLLASNVDNSHILQPSAFRLMPGTQYAIMDGPGGAQNLILLATAASGQMNALANMEQQQHNGVGGPTHAMQFVGGQQPNVRTVLTNGLMGAAAHHHNQQQLQQQQLQQQQRPTVTTGLVMKTEAGTGGTNIGHLPQLDGGVGNGRWTVMRGGGRGKANRTTVGGGLRGQNRGDGTSSSSSHTHMLPSKVAQLDGGKGKSAPGMTDESSEEEEDRDDEEDPTLSAIKYGLAEDHNEEGGEEDEAPLNSEDDQSDDEDLDTLFDADNVVVCQFEKVHRARNKWKFTLKDGVMQLRGKDYCFQKCTGEAEW